MVRSVMEKICASKMKAKLRGVVEVNDFVKAGSKGRSYHGKLGRPPREGAPARRTSR